MSMHAAMRQTSLTFLLACLAKGIVCQGMVSGESQSPLTCAVCSYTFAGETGELDLDCVQDFQNFDKKSSAPCASGLCWIRAAYSTGYERLNSIYRGCGTQNVSEIQCDVANSVNPSCQVTCSTSLCNDYNGDLWQVLKQNGGPGDAVACVTQSSSLLVISLTISFILYSLT